MLLSPPLMWVFKDVPGPFASVLSWHLLSLHHSQPISSQLPLSAVAQTEKAPLKATWTAQILSSFVTSLQNLP